MFGGLPKSGKSLFARFGITFNKVFCFVGHRFYTSYSLILNSASATGLGSVIIAFFGTQFHTYDFYGVHVKYSQELADVFTVKCLQRIFLMAVLTAFLCFAQTVHSDTTHTRVVTTARFDFHSDPWINLHHFLYQWARADENLGTARERVDVPERSSLANLAESQQEVWLSALSFYRESIAPLNHFDRRMLDQKSELLRLGGDLGAIPMGKIDGIADVLQNAMPLYVDEWWRVHDEDNRRWVRNIQSMLEESEDAYVHLTESLFESRWPDSPKRIDVSAYANFRVGYTAIGHTVIFSTDPGNQGFYGLESLFHEVQHSRDISGTGRSRLRAAFASAGVDVPENLWHSIIFVTAGAFVQSMVEQKALPAHTPYWVREGFAEFSGWRDPMRIVSANWIPAIEGELSSSEAFDGIAAAFDDQN